MKRKRKTANCLEMAQSHSPCVRVYQLPTCWSRCLLRNRHHLLWGLIITAPQTFITFGEEVRSISWGESLVTEKALLNVHPLAHLSRQLWAALTDLPRKKDIYNGTNDLLIQYGDTTVIDHNPGQIKMLIGIALKGRKCVNEWVIYALNPSDEYIVYFTCEWLI